MKKTLSQLGAWRGFLFPVLVGAGIILSVVFVVQPAFVRLSAGQEQIQQEEKRLVFLKQKTSQLKKLDEGTVQRRLQLLERAIPSQKDALSGLVLLRQLAADSGLSIETLSISPGVIGSSSAVTDLRKEAVFRGAINGSALNFLQFLNRFSTPTFPLFLPASVNLSQSGGLSSGLLSLKMLWQPPPNKYGGDDAPVAILNNEEETFIQWLERSAESSPSGAVVEEPVSTQSGRTTLF